MAEHSSAINTMGRRERGRAGHSTDGRVRAAAARRGMAGEVMGLAFEEAGEGLGHGSGSVWAFFSAGFEEVAALSTVLAIVGVWAIADGWPET